MADGKKLLVFVSSTYTDLREERQAAVEAILKAGHIPAGMELFTAGSKSQLQTIYNWIDQSDVYMLILGGRYGSLEPESLVSYVELEYDYAVNRGMPVFAVVINQETLDAKVRSQGASAIETDNKKQYEQFRAKVLCRISSFYNDLKDIKLCVHESLGDCRSDPRLAGWVSGKDIPDMSGLREEVERLKAENAELMRKLATPKRASYEDEFSELKVLLEATEVKVPGELSSAGEDTIISAQSLLLQFKDNVVSGVTNSASGSKMARFIYHSLMPKLKIHGLSENEKVTGVTYRRSHLSEKGERYLAWLEKERIKKA